MSVGPWEEDGDRVRLWLWRRLLRMRTTSEESSAVIIAVGGSCAWTYCVTEVYMRKDALVKNRGLRDQ